jgi:hypothetical protein
MIVSGAPPPLLGGSCCAKVSFEDIMPTEMAITKTQKCLNVAAMTVPPMEILIRPETTPQ